MKSRHEAIPGQIRPIHVCLVLVFVPRCIEPTYKTLLFAFALLLLSLVLAILAKPCTYYSRPSCHVCTCMFPYKGPLKGYSIRRLLPNKSP